MTIRNGSLVFFTFISLPDLSDNSKLTIVPDAWLELVPCSGFDVEMRSFVCIDEVAAVAFDPDDNMLDKLGMTTLGLSLEDENSWELELDDDETFWALTIRLIPFRSIMVTFDVSLTTPVLPANAVAAPDMPHIVCLAIWDVFSI